MSPVKYLAHGTDQWRWRWHQVKALVNEAVRRKKQELVPPQLGVIGAYHGQNVGDMSLGFSIVRCAEELKVGAGLQSIRNIGRWPICKSVIIGGGATGVKENLQRLAEHRAIQAERTTMLGMDFSSDVNDFPSHVLDYMRSVRKITCRSRQQTHKLQDALSRSDIVYQPDNAFALPFDEGSNPKTYGDKVLGVNSLNLFMTWNGKGFEPGTPLEAWYRKIGADIVPYIKKIGPSYIQVVREALESYRDRGWRIVHVPFTPEDDFFARIYFSKVINVFEKYSSDPLQILKKVGSCDRFVATRFHASVFALITRTPLIPILYAQKCVDLFNDIRESVDCGVGRKELADAAEVCVEKLVSAEPVQLSVKRIRDLRNETARKIRQSVERVVQ